jgi:hypothetical protein
MNSSVLARVRESIPAIRFWRTCLLALALSAFGLAGWLTAGVGSPYPSVDLTVHEWGTFTAVAGANGRAVEWTPLITLSDLPEFVEHLTDARLKPGLRGTIRLETPVLYFYSPRDVTATVSVAFSKGVITEWYPGATRVQPSGLLRSISLKNLQSDGSIAWDNVRVSPNLNADFPRESSTSRYYAAREASSAPLLVKTPSGDQQEKFLFYRGVSDAQLPLSATQGSDGKLVFRNLSGDEIPAFILFERRGERVGYRLAGPLTDETVLDPPVLDANVDSLRSDLERVLLEQGLYPDEARAMLDTWQDSWFEEGSRLIYIVPRAFVDGVLPLTVQPVPQQIVRVFVGRLEIVTPATAHAVQAALASKDDAVLDKYGRFLEPILRVIKEENAASTGDPRTGK